MHTSEVAATSVPNSGASIAEYLEMDEESDPPTSFLDRTVAGVVGLMQEVVARNPTLEPAQAAAIAIGMCHDAMIYTEETAAGDRCADEWIDQQRAWFGGWLRRS